MESVAVTKDDEIQVIADEYITEYLRCKNDFEKGNAGREIILFVRRIWFER